MVRVRVVKREEKGRRKVLGMVEKGKAIFKKTSAAADHFLGKVIPVCMEKVLRSKV